MKIEPVKTAIVGCGMISDAYLNTMINKFKILDVVGCCDLNLDKAQTTAQKYGIKVLSMEEILANESIEIVVNLTTPVAHYPVIKQLLEAGKHVYTEKVLSVEVEARRRTCKNRRSKEPVSWRGAGYISRFSDTDCKICCGQRHDW